MEGKGWEGKGRASLASENLARQGKGQTDLGAFFVV